MNNKIQTIADIEEAARKIARGDYGEYKWRDRDGNFHDPKAMETRHIFYVMLMIWNHSVPTELQVNFKHSYTFSDFYTRGYMAWTVLVMYHELKSRKLTAEQKAIRDEITLRLDNYAAGERKWITI